MANILAKEKQIAVIHALAEFDDADAHAPTDSPHEWVLEKDGKLQVRGCSPFRVLQLRPDAQISPHDASNGRWRYGHGLERCRSNRARMSERLANIQKAVEKAAECAATHLETVAVVEGFAGQIIWQGEVEIFTLESHAKAKRAYGWQIGDGKDAQFTAVLEIPPVDSPNTAVRAAIAAKARQ
jgi:hypothetical protein